MFRCFRPRVEPESRDRTRRRPFFILTAIALATFICSLEAKGVHLVASQDDAREAAPLQPGQSIERQLAGGQRHIYQIALGEDQYARVTVQQRGVDVAVRLLAPDGKQLANVDSARGLQEEETVELVAEAAGGYRLSVETSKANAQAGGYAIRFADLRQAT